MQGAILLIENYQKYLKELSEQLRNVTEELKQLLEKLEKDCEVEEKHSNFPPHIQHQLEEKGYFKLSPEERLAASCKCRETLSKLSIPNPEAGRRAIRRMRGYDDDEE